MNMAVGRTKVPHAPSPAPFSPVTLPTEHLAVGLYSPAAFAPWSDMVAFHLFEGELFVADSTYVVLLLPYGELYVIGKGTEVQIMLIAGQHIRDDAKGLLDFAVAHEAGYLFVEGCNVECLVMIGVIEICPVESFHDFLELLHVEIGGCPIQHVLEISPQVVGIGVVLMLRHIPYECLWLSAAGFVGRHPFKSPFEEVLTDGSAIDQVLAQAIGSAS